MIRNLATKILLLVGRITGRFITFHTRPMVPAGLGYTGKETPEDALCAIVIQGPIRHEDDFTLESVKLYRRHYPAATIILSTWEGEEVSGFKSMEDGRFEIVFSKKPSIRGIHNINMQIVTTKAGTEKAFEKGLRYTLKTRTDQRMYGINTLAFMQHLLEFFPVLGTEKQKKRVISIESGTSKTWPYHFSDLFMFGDSSDMQQYWNADLTPERPATSNGFFLPEGYLLTEFLRKAGWQVKNTMADFLKALGERCIVIDNEAADVYWPKYAAIWREYRLKNYFSPTFEISFKVWLNDAFIPVQKEKTLQV